MTTEILSRVSASLARLCERAGADPDDRTEAAASRVAGVLRRTGCFHRRDLSAELHLPDVCPLAVWVRLEAAVPWEYAVCVSGQVNHGHGPRDPGRAILLGEWEGTGESRVLARRESGSVPLPWVLSNAVRSIDRLLDVGEEAA
jgi:hypothetical protein